MVKDMEKKLKAYAVTGIAAVAALAVMIGVYQNIDQDNGKDAKIVQEAQQNSQQENGSNEVAAGQSNGNEVAASQSDTNEMAAGTEVEYEGYEDAQQVLAERQVAERQNLSEAGSDASSEAAFSQKQSSFGKNSSVQWPVKGNVIMNYSMDKTVYFATLDQYKYNPALVIQANVNDKVIAGVAGTVEEIAVTEETGTTVTLNLGGGYRAIYGQLKEVPKKEGDTVAADTVLGYIAEPTKYYSLEGSNLYFAMEKDGKPINPMGFLK